MRASAGFGDGYLDTVEARDLVVPQRLAVVARHARHALLQHVAVALGGLPRRFALALARHPPAQAPEREPAWVSRQPASRVQLPWGARLPSRPRPSWPVPPCARSPPATWRVPPASVPRLSPRLRAGA